MSKIGRTPIIKPANTTVTVQDNLVHIKGPKGEQKVEIATGIAIEIESERILVSRKNELRQTKANHGLVRSLLQNAILGVTEGYSKVLKLVGTGYRAQAQGQGLQLALGFSHPVIVSAIPGITFKVENQDTITVSGIDKQSVGQVAANIRALRPPEPYQGKGIRYADEEVRRKQGKATTK